MDPLSYLAAGLLSGRRVLVSTGTRNLQDQIFHKDIPALARVAHAHGASVVLDNTYVTRTSRAMWVLIPRRWRDGSPMTGEYRIDVIGSPSPPW